MVDDSILVSFKNHVGNAMQHMADETKQFFIDSMWIMPHYEEGSNQADAYIVRFGMRKSMNQPVQATFFADLVIDDKDMANRQQWPSVAARFIHLAITNSATPPASRKETERMPNPPQNGEPK